MSANLISATRTGAVPAVATKYLASKKHTLYQLSEQESLVGQVHSQF